MIVNLRKVCHHRLMLQKAQVEGSIKSPHMNMTSLQEKQINYFENQIFSFLFLDAELSCHQIKCLQRTQTLHLED